MPSPKPTNSRNTNIALQWFRDLPIQRKQLCGLFTSEVISLIGLVGVSAALIINGGRSLLMNQAASELAVTEINYNIKIDQMGFGFRGQSDNVAIIAASQAHADGQPLPDNLKTQVKQILQNEVQARNIEYATLVGQDLKIIANANVDRTGERFDPHNLVSAVFNNPQQIKTSELIDWSEIVKESPPLISELSEQNALIRYTVTPVFEPNSQQVIGALVSGDIVNDKPQISLKTLAVQGGGYSSVYLRNSEGEFALATAAQSLVDQYQQATIDLEVESLTDTDYALNVGLESPEVLQAAIAADGEVVTQRATINQQTYTVAAKSLNNFAGEPIAVLVRGTPEFALNALLRNSLFFQAFVAALALTADVFLAILLSRAIARPIRRLQTITQEFTQGRLQARVPTESTDEVGKLSSQFNLMADQLMEREQTIQTNFHDLELTLAELKKTQSRLIQSEKMSGLGQLVAGLAHEFNNPLSFIYGNLNHAKDYTTEIFRILHLYQQQYPQPKAEILAAIDEADLEFLATDLPKMFESMEFGVQRIRKILDSLNGFSHLGQSELKSVDIHTELDNILELLHGRLGGRIGHPDIEVARQYGALPIVECYARQLNQVLINLLNNAIDALDAKFRTQERSPTTQKPTVSLTTYAQSSDAIVIQIQDNGEGIAPDIQPKLFDPFFTTKPVGQGTGLGLSTSYQIVVEQHGGSITCESSPGQGATFSIEIPVRQTHTPSTNVTG